MYKIVLYCKSYRKDISRIKILNESIVKHNVENIPFYVSCPKSDLEIFAKELKGVKLIFDEDIIGSDFEQNWQSQQVVKLNFYKMNIAENYLVIDSDSYFIRDFYYSDFIDDQGKPYFVCFEDKLFFEFLARRKLKFIIEQTKESFSKIAKVFNRNDRVLYSFGSPCIWNAEVLKSLEESLLSKNLDFDKMINLAPYEMNWYGEFLLSSPNFRFRNIGSLSKIYHYEIFYREEKLLGQKEEFLLQNYLMVIMQNKWVKDVVFKPSIIGNLINWMRNFRLPKNRKRIKMIKNKVLSKK